MLFTILSWLIIVIVFTGIGSGLAKLINKVFGYEIRYLHSVIMLGLVFCTVYAEAFSTVYKVGRAAFAILGIFLFLMLLYSGGEICEHLAGIKKNLVSNRLRACCIFVAFLAYLFLASYVSSRAPVGFDTLNYHIPDIRWLEEYGAVKGLGNLANWHAYNSSFHCLQALFSFSWVGGMSYHSMNGFIWIFMVVYSFTTLSFFSKERFGMSDVLRITFLWLLFGCISWGNNEPLAAPMTDFLPMCLVGYIFVEWSSLNERAVDNEVPYGLLGILGIFAASVKLSAATLALFAIKPCVGLIKRHRYGDLLGFACLGIAVTAPFLVRNVIISGYLLYPVAGIDIFNVDWKMPRSVIVSDNVYIRLFARNEGSYPYENVNMSFKEWFEVWQKRHYSWHAMGALRNLIAAPCILVVSLYMMLRKRKGNYDHILYIEAAVSFMFLILSAPSLRFGMIWLYVFTVVCVYGMVDNITGGAVVKESLTKIAASLQNNRGYTVMTLIVILFCSVNFQRMLLDDAFDAKIIPKDYIHVSDLDDEYTYEISGHKFYYTNSDSGKNRTDEGYDGLLGYDRFPGSCNLAYLKKMEMRGNKLSDGFRVKEEFRNYAYGHSGYDLSPEEIKLLGLERYYQ